MRLKTTTQKVIPALFLIALPGCAVWDVVSTGNLQQVEKAASPTVNHAAPIAVTAESRRADISESAFIHSSSSMSNASQTLTTLGINAALFEDNNLPADDEVYRLEADALLSKVNRMDNLRPEQQEALLKGQEFLFRVQGREAYRVLSALESELSAERMTYTLLQHDSLQRMTRKADIYANPWMWGQQLASSPDSAEAARTAVLNRQSLQP